ncbi:MAG: c-type cytochrome [Alphaproteobacteria bacterium]|nr:c-type cytochrome [Alphaproteobacteria bacterium]
MRLPTSLIAAAVATAFSLQIAGAGSARADMASSVVLANTCFSCHGTEGQSVGAMPTIKGKPAKYIETQLMAFRAGKKSSTVMGRIAKGFNADEIKALSRYFSGSQ